MRREFGEPTSEVAAYRPHWVVWGGRQTGSYWAMPNWPGAPRHMVEAPDMDTLDERMIDIENRYPATLMHTSGGDRPWRTDTG